MIDLKGYLIAAAFAAVLASAGTAIVYESRIIPGRVEAAEKRAAEAATAVAEERAAMLATAAAAQAVAGELRRRQDAVNRALAAHEAQATAEAAALANRLEQVEAERTRYAEELRASGRTCPYDLAIERYLDGLPIDGPAEPANGGAGGGRASRVFGLN